MIAKPEGKVITFAKPADLEAAKEQLVRKGAQVRRRRRSEPGIGRHAPTWEGQGKNKTRGSKRLVPVREPERWLDREARLHLESDR